MKKPTLKAQREALEAKARAQGERITELERELTIAKQHLHEAQAFHGSWCDANEKRLIEHVDTMRALRPARKGRG